MENHVAYIAGVMDSEGSFSITWSKHQATTAGIVSIANTNLKLLQFVMEHFGGKLYVYPTTQSGARTTCYCWQPGAAGIEHFIRSVRPFLICKGEQADVMLEHLSLRMHRLTPEARKRRLELRDRMLELNQSKIRGKTTIALTGDERATGEYNWRPMES